MMVKVTNLKENLSLKNVDKDIKNEEVFVVCIPCSLNETIAELIENNDGI